LCDQRQRLFDVVLARQQRQAQRREQQTGLLRADTTQASLSAV
jgi:hypothetical protein